MFCTTTDGEDDRWDDVPIQTEDTELEKEEG